MKKLFIAALAAGFMVGCAERDTEIGTGAEDTVVEPRTSESYDRGVSGSSQDISTPAPAPENQPPTNQPDQVQPPAEPEPNQDQQSSPQ